jgi:hypothetical protein
MKHKTCSYSSIVRSSGVYDIVLMIPFAIPGVVSWTMTQLGYLHANLSLSGTFPEFSAFHLFFINLMAFITIVWSVLRVRTPIPRYGIYDTVARFLIAALMLVYLLKYNVSEILWLFFISEIAWAMLQINGHLFKQKAELKYAATTA